jgi:hypothetical protein
MTREGPDAPPRGPTWGCLFALIVGAVGMVIAVVLAVRLAGTALSGVRIR